MEVACLAVVYFVECTLVNGVLSHGPMSTATIMIKGKFSPLDIANIWVKQKPAKSVIILAFLTPLPAHSRNYRGNQD